MSRQWKKFKVGTVEGRDGTDSRLPSGQRVVLRIRRERARIDCIEYLGEEAKPQRSQFSCPQIARSIFAPDRDVALGGNRSAVERIIHPIDRATGD